MFETPAWVSQLISCSYPLYCYSLFLNFHGFIGEYLWLSPLWFLFFIHNHFPYQPNPTSAIPTVATRYHSSPALIHFSSIMCNTKEIQCNSRDIKRFLLKFFLQIWDFPWLILIKFLSVHGLISNPRLNSHNSFVKSQTVQFIPFGIFLHHFFYIVQFFVENFLFV